MTSTRSASERISSSSSETSSTPRPGVALLEQPPVDELDRADVEPARRLGGDRDAAAPRRARARSRTSAGCRPTASRPASRGWPPRTSYSSSSGRACASIRFGREQAQAAQRRAPVLAQREVLGEREVEHEAAPVAVLGDVADAGRERAAHAGAGDVAPADADPGRRRGTRSPVIASTSSDWPLPSTPAMPTISPARTWSESPRTAGSPRSSIDLEALDLEQRLARRSPPSFSTRKRTSRPTISLARLASVAPSVGDRVDLLAAPQHGDAVGDLEHLAQLVRDEDDRDALGGERAQHLEQLGRLLRGEHGRRLVEDQHVGAAVQHAQDLDALLLADADVLHVARAGRRRGRSARTARAPAASAASRSSSTPLRGSDASTTFSATVMTGMSMKCWCTMPIRMPIASRGEPMCTGSPRR